MFVRKLHRGATSGGRYARHQFLIEFSKDVPFVSLARRPTRELLHLFAHEYWHYWHNISTIAGVKQLLVSQDLLALFGNTLMNNGDGTSVGSDTAGDQQRRISNLLTIDANVEGDVAPTGASLLDDLELTFTVESTRVIDDHISVEGGVVPLPKAQVELLITFGDGSQKAASLRLGTAIIEEGIAIVVEEQVQSRTTGAVRYPAPGFPYRVLQRVVDHIAGATLEPFYAAALGTLALLDPHPGSALLRLARSFREALDIGNGATAALSAVVVTTQAERDRTADHFIPRLDRVPARLRKRGLLEGAAQYIIDQTRTALELRRRDPLLDLYFVFNAAPVGGMLALQTFFPCCDVLQERERADPDEYNAADPAYLRDALVLMSQSPADRRGFRSYEYLRTFQAMQGFVQSHLDRKNGAFFPSSAARPLPCPYFTTCPIEFRQREPETCAKEPWRAFSFSARQNCWYGLAVAGSLGPHEILPRKQTQKARTEAGAANRRQQVRGGALIHSATWLVRDLAGRNVYSSMCAMTLRDGACVEPGALVTCAGCILATLAEHLDSIGRGP